MNEGFLESCSPKSVTHNQQEGIDFSFGLFHRDFLCCFFFFNLFQREIGVGVRQPGSVSQVVSLYS